MNFGRAKFFVFCQLPSNLSFNHKKVLKINKETIILNNDLTLDSLEFLDLIIYIEKKTKKKFLSYKSNDLINLKVRDLLKFFN